MLRVGIVYMIIAYFGPFIILASIPIFYDVLGAAGPFATVALLLLALIGAEVASVRGEPIAPKQSSRAFRLLAFAYVPLQLIAIVWAMNAAVHETLIDYLALLFSIGILTGVFGMLTAHELIHSKSDIEKLFGTAMLTGMCHRHFRVSHVYGHHRHAGTINDPSTARFGEGFYAFLWRTVPGQVADAWAHEKLRSAKRGPLANRIYGDAAIMLAIFAAIFALWGWKGILFFAVQSAIGMITLELFNYIAHYGLVRRAIGDGRLEPFGDEHSWNSSNIFANTIIFNMGRHSDHHRRPAAQYQDLHYKRVAPELPAGYAGSILLAMVPPLWRRVMDPAVHAAQAPQLQTAG
ncbi:MAG TPA: alkane 1-monooxygenase [Rhizomicrobium sp.]